MLDEKVISPPLRPDGPMYYDVVKEIQFPQEPLKPGIKERGILEEASDQTASIRRLVQVGREMAEWRQYSDRRMIFVAETFAGQFDDVARWIKAGVVVMCFVQLVFSCTILVR